MNKIFILGYIAATYFFVWKQTYSLFICFFFILGLGFLTKEVIKSIKHIIKNWNGKSGK